MAGNDGLIMIIYFNFIELTPFVLHFQYLFRIMQEMTSHYYFISLENEATGRS